VPTPAQLPALAPEPTRSVTVDLATSKALAASEPEPSSPPAAIAPSAAAVAAPPAIVARPVAVESAAASPISSRAAWAVQLGSFASRANAEALSRQLKGKGFPVYVLPGGAAHSLRYRVRIGPLADHGSADRTAAKLKSMGHVASLVAPAG
jgi:cell division septation protein DedD